MRCLVVLWVILLSCASEARSPPKECGQFEERRECGPSCPPTCDTLGEEVCCVVKCVPGCFCVDGHIRDPDNKCVAIDACPSPGVLRFEKLELIVSEGSKVAVLTVVRVNGSHGRITVRWRVQGAPPPYSDLTGLLIFDDEVLSQSIQIPVTDNDVKDPDIILKIELFEPSEKTNVEPRRRESTLIIKDNDMRPGYLEMESLSVSVSESVGEVSVRVVRVDGEDGTLIVLWKTVGGTADAGGDFINTSGKVEFKEGVTKQIIKIRIKDDDVREAKEAFRVELFDPSVGPGVINFRARGSRLSTLVIIEDDDMTPGYPEMAETKVQVSEAAGQALIRVVRQDGTDGSITVRYRILPGTAQPSLDYVPLNTDGSLVFPEGVNEQTINVLLVDDNVREPEERFRVELFDPSPGPGVIKFRARGTIMVTEVIVSDNDMSPGILNLERDFLSVNERVEALRVWVKREGGEDGEVRVRWRTVTGVAVATEDFVNASGELVFLEGEKRKSFLVHIVDDNIREKTENFYVEIFDAKPGPGVLNFNGLGPTKRTDIIIQDDDMNPGQLVLQRATYEVLENVGNVNLAVVREGGTDGQIRVHWRTLGEGTYFMSVSGELVFEEGDTIKAILVPIIDNEIRDIGTRSFEVQLYDPSSGIGVINFRGLGGITRTVINIKDDDAHPGHLELQESTYKIIEGVPTVTVSVVRVGGTDGILRVNWTTTSNVSKFETTKGEIYFYEGQSRNEITVTKPAGNFAIELYNLRPELETHTFRSFEEKARIDIKLDAFPEVLEFEEPSYTISEGAGFVSIGVVRSIGTGGEVRVHWKAVPGSAQQPTDFKVNGTEVVFAPNQHRKFIIIQIVDDNVKEDNETFEVELVQDSVDGVDHFGGPGKALRTEALRTVVTIIDDDKPAESRIFFMKSTLEVPRNEESAGFYVRRNEESSDSSPTFLIETLQFDGEGAAIPNVDYRPIRGNVTFEAHQVALRFMVRLLPNPKNRAPFKIFLVRISLTKGNGVVVPGRDILTVILRDLDLLLKGHVSQPETSFESPQVKSEIHSPPPSLEFRGGEKKETPKCPAGLTFKECEPTCQKKCGGVHAPTPCHLRGCVKGCFCPTGMLFDDTTSRCVTECPGTKCPPGLTYNPCAPACQETCPGMEVSGPCGGHGGCVEGCYCPPGLVLDHTVKNCILPSQCSAGQQGIFSRGLTGGLQSQVQGGLQSGQVQVAVQRTSPRGLLGGGLPVSGLQSGLQGQVQSGLQTGGLAGIGGGLLLGR